MSLPYPSVGLVLKCGFVADMRLEANSAWNANRAATFNSNKWLDSLVPIGLLNDRCDICHRNIPVGN